MSDRPKKAYILPHTHWDREWRYPIWRTRALLVRFIDELLELLEKDEQYRCFLMDGQVAPVLDYLEIKPHNRERIRGYIEQGRIAVGPWYTLPDLYPVDGECLVRNLLWGKRTAEMLGKCLDIGYNSFGWGQTAQFPQIYAGFGIDFIICAKRVSEERAPESEFMWQAPDGTTVLTSKLGEHARANFYFNAYLKGKYGVNCFSSDFRYDPSLSGMAMHNASTKCKDEDFFVISPNLSYDKKDLAEGFSDAWKATDASVLENHRLFLDGTDFSSPQSQISAMRADLSELIEDTDFLHCRLDEYANVLRENVDINKLRVINGELRDGPAGECSGNALSSRIYLKIANKQAQNALLAQAEPLSSAIWALGGKYQRGMLDKAWDYLLKSHPHDSINGVTQDKTANDVQYRLAQALEIGQVITDEALAYLARGLNLSAFGKKTILLLVYNPLPYSLKDIGKLCIATPAREHIWDFTAIDAATGEQLQVQEISRDEKAYPVHDAEARPWPFITHRHECYIDFGELPAMGYKVIEIVPQQRFGPEKFYWLPMRRANDGNILTDNNVLENAHLRAEFNTSGTIRLLHKESGKVYDNLHYFEDAGDVGNYWAYYPPYHNQVHITKSCPARIWSEDNGPLSATVAVEYTMQLPAEAEESVYGVRGKGKRSDKLVEYKILSRFTLTRDSKRLDVHTIINNNAKNHRLRVAFPTGIQADYADSAGHFTVDRRPKVNQRAADGSYWPEMQTLPMQSFVDVSDSKTGLALLNDCLTEYEFANDGQNTLYLTLFRAMGNMIVTWWEAVGQFDSQDGSQLLRKMEFNYAIYPHIGNWSEGSVYREAQGVNAATSCSQLYGGEAGSFPLTNSFCSISNQNLIFSALKQSENGQSIILRLFNPTADKQSGTVTFGFPVSKARKCKLNEDPLEDLVLSGENLTIDVAGGEIFTIEVSFCSYCSHAAKNG
ncbi:MAG: glycosyl hydrolase-related protein [Oscillospiraceae bacterium]|nr:glycosyl hydrolase-related protein [Oscillospiraceae bacterium]MCL2280067.1 glycosyl hydrolase-related protein [Oscillospiraceae bacterium]